MHLVFLGTGSGAPTRGRNVSSLALRLPESREIWLFDCGEATQHQLLRSPFSPSQIRRIFITHLHGDHVLGLPGLIASMGLAGDNAAVNVYGPRGIRDFLQAVFHFTHFRPGFSLEIEEVSDGIVFDSGEFSVRAQRLVHPVPCFGYRIEEVTRSGHLDPDKAKALGVPPGPLFGCLKRGEDVTLHDGSVVRSADVVGADIPGRKVAYCTDTIPCPGAVTLARDCDVLIHEATFGTDQESLAPARGHSTNLDAARTAVAANAHRLIMTHVSPRYAPGNSIRPEDLVNEARAIFPQTIMAHDLMTFDVPARA